jgi:hypothetical protein
MTDLLISLIECFFSVFIDQSLTLEPINAKNYLSVEHKFKILNKQKYKNNMIWVTQSIYIHYLG